VNISEKRMSQLIAVIRELAVDKYRAAVPGADAYAGARGRRFHATVYPGWRVVVTRRGKTRRYEVKP
jgi:hypothetical protein